jgi:chaperonin cofactor prefoldin
MADAPKSLEDQLQEQQESLGNQIKDLETQLMRAKEGYLKVQGALEILAIQKQQAEAAETTTTEVADQ